nr:type I restriction endonuclease [Helicobacter baculiformis]
MQLEKLNNLCFSDSEWERFYQQSNPINTKHMNKSHILQRDHVRHFKFANGESKNIKFLDKERMHNNFLQAIYQYKTSDSKNRYDASILVNGLLLRILHIELKKEV